MPELEAGMVFGQLLSLLNSLQYWTTSDKIAMDR
jgi:hypothetical protein